ncbi:hypothetical protein SteCoe_5537 [Stentor coeruleus]|uniref:NET domain-containing protein n=1 Tax=Stentor coeruleus TaxID=5963 RepID=A0A1R2CSA5_9CILI|nr:hypothetical protein SteCoe_5537 [Stentor coeruleus]
MSLDLFMKISPETEATLELTCSQVQMLNSLLPGRFKIEYIDQRPYKTVRTTKRRPELEHSAPWPVPAKRPIREKEPSFLAGQSEGFKKCYKLIQALKRYPLSHKLLALGPSTKNNSPTINQTDLSLSENPILTIENNFITGEYLSVYHLKSDLRKIISNAFLTHSQNGDVFIQIFELSKFCDAQFQGLDDLVFSENIIQDLKKNIDKLTQNIKEAQSKIPSIKGLKDKKMTSSEKKQLVQSLRKLEPKFLSGVLKIVRGSDDVEGDELEFDLEKLPSKKCRELEKYIKQCLQVKQNNRSCRNNKGNEGFRKEDSRVSIKKQPEPTSESSESSSVSSESDDMAGMPMFPDFAEHDFSDFSQGISIDYYHY